MTIQITYIFHLLSFSLWHMILRVQVYLSSIAAWTIHRQLQLDFLHMPQKNVPEVVLSGTEVRLLWFIKK